MKHLFVFLLFSLFLNMAMAQEKVKLSTSQSLSVAAASTLSANLSDSVKIIQFELQKLKYESAYVRHCLRKHHQEKTNGYFLSFFGGVIMGASMGLTDNHVAYNGTKTTEFSSTGEMLFVGGAAMSLLGTIMIIDSEKWLKRAYIGPDGLGVKINF